MKSSAEFPNKVNVMAIASKAICQVSTLLKAGELALNSVSTRTLADGGGVRARGSRGLCPGGRSIKTEFY